MSTRTPSDRTRRVAWAPLLAFALGSTRALADDSVAPSSPTTAVSSDALDPLRERFKVGMEKYRAGQYAEAIVTWEAIYRELGAEKGYRLAFNLARAYDAYGDPSRAAEHYATYVAEVARRRAAGETLDPNLDKQDAEAKARLADLATSGKPRTVTSTPAERRDESRAEPARSAASAGPAPVRTELRLERPFASTWLWVGGAATLVSTIVPIVTYTSASSIRDDYESSATPIADKPELAASYDAARDTAYATLAIPIALGAMTLGLTAWWLFGAKEARVPVALHAGRIAF